MSKQKSLIIIGAGIAGLATGCYGQINGYQTRIFEMHDKPGGLCTAWSRKGYTFDGCIHHHNEHFFTMQKQGRSKYKLGDL